MPYRRNAELPDAVRRHLPAQAQDIFRVAFNGAWEGYRDRSEDREALAFRAAWAAVKRKYQQTGEMWERKDDSE
ncbi:MAG: ChaB family protein [Rhodospirillales bacterium]|nr:ChaB family protein [Rhodospirillales bacterium]